MPSFKLFVEVSGAQEIRRFSTQKAISWEEFLNELQRVLRPYFHPELRIQYVDSEGDRITISSEEEWREAMNQLTQEPHKFYVSEQKHGIYFKDSPQPQILGFYVKDESKTEKKTQPIEEKKPVKTKSSKTK